MDVHQLLGRRPRVDPANDALIEATDNVAAAGVVPSSRPGTTATSSASARSARRASRPTRSRSPRSRTATSSTPALDGDRGRRAGEPQAGPVLRRRRRRRPAAWARPTRRSSTPARSPGTDGQPVDRQLCGKGARPNDPPRTTLPAGSLQGAIALVFRGSCSFDSKARRARRGRRASASSSPTTGPARRTHPDALVLPAGWSPTSTAPAARLPGRGTAARAIRVGRDDRTRSRRAAAASSCSFSSAGPTRVRPPAQARPRGARRRRSSPRRCPSSRARRSPSSTGRAWPRRTSTGAAALLLQLHPGWTPRAGEVGAHVDRGPGLGRHRAHEGGARSRSRAAGSINVARADDPQLFTDPVSLSFDDLDVNHGAQPQSLLVTLTDAGGGGGHVAGRAARRSRPRAGSSVTCPATRRRSRPAAGRRCRSRRARADGAPRGDDSGFIVLRRGTDTRRVPYYFSVDAARRSSSSPQVTLAKLQVGDTGTGTSHASTLPLPGRPLRRRRSSYTGAADARGRRREALRVPHQRRRRRTSASSVAGAERRRADRPVPARLAGRERRPGLRGHAVRTSTPSRSTSVRPGRPRASTSRAEGVLRRRRLAARHVHGRALHRASTCSTPGSNDVTPPQRPAADDARRGRPADARRAVVDRRRLRRRPALARDRATAACCSAPRSSTRPAARALPAPGAARRRSRSARRRRIAVASDFQETKNVDQAGDEHAAEHDLPPARSAA